MRSGQRSLYAEKPADRKVGLLQTSSIEANLVASPPYHPTDPIERKRALFWVKPAECLGHKAYSSLPLFEQPVSCGLDVEELSGRSHVIDVRKGQEGDVASLAEIAVDLVGQLLLIFWVSLKIRTGRLLADRPISDSSQPAFNILWRAGYKDPYSIWSRSSG